MTLKNEMMMQEKVAGKENGDLFVSVRQRVAAYKLYRTFWGEKAYGDEDEDEYLDGSYRFLNSSVDPDFIRFCAKSEKMDLLEYVSGLLGDNGG